MGVDHGEHHVLLVAGHLLLPLLQRLQLLVQVVHHFHRVLLDDIVDSVAHLPDDLLDGGIEQLPEFRLQFLHLLLHLLDPLVDSESGGSLLVLVDGLGDPDLLLRLGRLPVGGVGLVGVTPHGHTLGMLGGGDQSIQHGGVLLVPSVIELPINFAHVDVGHITDRLTHHSSMQSQALDVIQRALHQTLVGEWVILGEPVEARQELVLCNRPASRVVQQGHDVARTKMRGDLHVAQNLPHLWDLQALPHLILAEGPAAILIELLHQNLQAL
mmetsp:Transcript_16184/g.41245  ORF Transcript_16184/g.41245 Transcript_16184/m.41245 type:complete len:270 (-) Transcript_16184:1063-1872(-)